MTTTKYLMQELGFKASEWSQLSAQDKADLRQWAREEMAVLGIEVKE